MVAPSTGVLAVLPTPVTGPITPMWVIARRRGCGADDGFCHDRVGKPEAMGDQLFGILIVLLALVGAVAGASYVYAFTAEREPEREPRPGSRVSH
jgi:hypothetical protein